MPLPLFLQRLRQRSSKSVVDAPALSSADIEVARVRARRRLVGMVVLMGVGVVGLPWLFETQPRPLSPDIQVVSAVPSPHASLAAGASQAIVSMTGPVADDEDGQIETVDAPPTRPSEPPAPASRPAVPASTPAAAHQPVPAAPSRSASKAVVKEHKDVAKGPSKERDAVKTVARAESARPAPSPAANAASKDAARARALLDDKATAPKPVISKAATAPAPASKPTAKLDADATRYVVQIGAFSEATAAHEVRAKAERAGIKTYTQEITASGGKKIRVRLGPYASKAEADKAMDSLRKAGMTGAVLTL